MNYTVNYTTRFFGTVDSTNILASTLAEDGAPEGTVVIAEEQTAGKGRKGDHWFSARGGLWFTLILRQVSSPHRSLLLPLLMGISVHRAVQRFGISSRIKLPNDVLVGEKKLCGILCENRLHKDLVRYVLVGVGVNVSNEPPEMGVACHSLVSDPPEVRELMDAILQEFDQEYAQFLSSDYFFGEEFEP